MADGQWVRTAFIGLVYQDASSGTNVLIAEPKDCAPEGLATNQVLYADALDDVSCDVIYRYTRLGVSQNIVLRAMPPSPESFGLDSSNVHLLAISELLDSPTPTVEKHSRKGQRWADQTLNFGAMRMVPGRAFDINAVRPGRGAPVTKQYETVDGRKLIVERVPYAQIRSSLLKLPSSLGATSNGREATTTNSSVQKSSKWFAEGTLPRVTPMIAKLVPAKKQVEFAAATGFVIDWELVGAEVGRSFSSGIQYVISGECHLAGAEFEPGVVLRYEPGSSLYIDGPLTWTRGSTWESNSVVLTSVDEDELLGQVVPAPKSAFRGSFGPALIVDSADLPLASSRIENRLGSPGIVAHGAATPSVTVMPANSDASSVAFTLTREDGDLDQPLTVWVKASEMGMSSKGSAMPISIEAGQESATFAFRAATEGGAITVAIQSDPADAYLVGTPQLATVGMQALSSEGQNPLLINIDFCAYNHTQVSAKSGPAAIGQSSWDFWNGLSCPNQYSVARTNLLSAQTNGTSVILTITNTPGAWGLGSSDAMYDGYLYPNSGQTGIVQLANLPAGTCEVYIYGYDGNYDLAVAGTSYGNRQNRDWPSYSSPWAEGTQYVRFPNVSVAAGQTLTVTLRPGTGGYAVLSGMQVLMFFPPSITAQPASSNLCEGGTFSLGVTAGGTAPLSYQWKHNGQAIAGATTNTYTKNYAQPSDGGNYSVVVSNLYGSVTSGNAYVTVYSSASITNQPQSLTVCQGDLATFTVGATGTGPVTYQWFKGGSPIWGATTNVFTTNTALLASAGVYSVGVTNGCGGRLSTNATLTVNRVVSITNQPQSLTVCQGNLATFTVGATGTAPISYQWFKGGAPIWGATSNVLTTNTTLSASAGVYSVGVSNACGGRLSTNATLTLNRPAAITNQPQSLTVHQGNLASFSVGAAGTAPITYQWFKAGWAIWGATSSVFTTNTTLPASAGVYTVGVSNACGATLSTNAILVLD
jgi:hypothetical protein